MREIENTQTFHDCKVIYILCFEIFVDINFLSILLFVGRNFGWSYFSSLKNFVTYQIFRHF